MARPVNEVEQAVSRTLRDSLERLQRTTEDLNQSVHDVVSACASARPSNTLPPLLRAQTLAASLQASLEVLSRFVASSLPQPTMQVEAETEAPVITEPMLTSQPQETVEEIRASDMMEEGAPVTQPGAGQIPEQFEETQQALAPLPVEEVPEPSAAFSVSSLSLEDQELHRRASRVAKVSMQDIKMLRPDAVRLGMEHKDLCQRLRDDIEKAHKEYDRRFQTILGHPVDYFYDWMVQILGEGNPENLGEYPYASPALRR